MEIVVREVFESGSKRGVLYEPADIRRARDDVPDPNVRVVRWADGSCSIRPAHRTFNLQFRGRWEFATADFRALADMIRRWLRDRYRMGGYVSYQSAGPHSRTFYYPPGGVPKPIEVGLRWEEEVRRIAGTPRVGLSERATFVNQRKDIVARAFEWRGLALYWLRDQIGLIRGRRLASEEECVIVECGMTIEFNVEPSPGAYLVLCQDDILYLKEVALLQKARARAGGRRRR